MTNKQFADNKNEQLTFALSIRPSVHKAKAAHEENEVVQRTVQAAVGGVISLKHHRDLTVSAWYLLRNGFLRGLLRCCVNRLGALSALTASWRCTGCGTSAFCLTEIVLRTLLFQLVMYYTLIRQNGKRIASATSTYSMPVVSLALESQCLKAVCLRIRVS